jgi:hypothetical protein
MGLGRTQAGEMNYWQRHANKNTTVWQLPSGIMVAAFMVGGVYWYITNDGHTLRVPRGSREHYTNDNQRIGHERQQRELERKHKDDARRIAIQILNVLEQNAVTNTDFASALTLKTCRIELENQQR